MTHPPAGRAQPRVPWLLLAGDVLALSVFVLLGLGAHAAGASAWQRFGLNAGPLVLAWLAVGWPLGAFRLDPRPALRPVLIRTLAAWLAAAPLGLLLRALLVGSPTVVVVFVLVTLFVGGALLLVWRALYVGLASRPR